MRTKNAVAITKAEHEHIGRVKKMACIVCRTPGPSDAHHIEQGDHWTVLPLCESCHKHPVYGWHGQRARWKLEKLDEVGALNLLIPRLLAPSP